MHFVENAREVPEYEIDPKELDFTGSVDLTKGTYRIASWRGTKVAVKTFWEGIADEDKVTAFRDELALLQKVRHPNVVQFLGAVTQCSPMMIVTEYLPKFRDLMLKKSALLSEPHEVLWQWIKTPHHIHNPSPFLILFALDPSMQSFAPDGVVSGTNSVISPAVANI